MNPTPASPDLEVEMVRRLGDLADTMAVDDGWDPIEARFGAGARRPRPNVRLLVAVAAVLLLVLSAVALVVRSRGDDDRLRTVDDTTTTTRPGRRTPPTSRRSPATTPSTVIPGSGPLGAPVPGSGPGVGPGSGLGSGSGPAAGSGGPAGSGGSGGSAGAGGAAPPAGPPGSHAPVRMPPISTLASSEYAVEFLFDPHPDTGVDAPTLFLRRTDDVGNQAPQPGGVPDDYGYAFAVVRANLGTEPHDHCVFYDSVTLDFDDAAPHAFAFGFAGAGIAHVEVTMADGSRVVVQPGGNVVHSGLRPWLVEIPVTRAQRMEGRDATGSAVAESDIHPPGSPPYDGQTAAAEC